MIHRASLADVPAVARLLNDPVIRPTIGGEGELDPTALLADARNICLFNDRGGMLFAWRGPGIYEVHVFFLARGREALDLGANMIGQVSARMIWGLIPPENTATLWFSRQLGFHHHGPMLTPTGPRELVVLEIA